MNKMDEILEKYEVNKLKFKKPVFLNDWLNSTQEDIKGEFGDVNDDVKILFASYTYEDYSGDAWVLFIEDDKLYEVHGGHCSCYGITRNGYC